MAKAEWGTKRTCPKCGTRFYDLTKDDPITCIECGHEWQHEPVLKAKQPIVATEKAKPEKTKKDDSDDDEDLDIDDDDDDLDLDDDDDDDDVLGDVSLDDEDSDVSDVVDTKLSDDD